MGQHSCGKGSVLLGVLVLVSSLKGATVQKKYYAHQAVHDKNGVLAPWYTGQNGVCDFRVRVAAETLKRYPWVLPPQAVAAAPHFVFNGHWKITADGTITAVPISPWDNGDLGQRASYVLSGLVDYYRYSGDPAAIALLTYQGDVLLDHCCTPADHPWPRFLISVPTKGVAYRKCDPKGMIQLDIVAEVGLALLKAYQVTGNTRWLEACQHWGDLMAARCNRRPGAAPWGRYANPECASWKDDKQTGGVVFILYFLDELLRLGHRGKDNAILQARDAGRAYLRDVLLPQWTINDVWGRNYWDWPDPVQAENVTEFAARYFMDNQNAFPNWRNDARNILSLFLNHTSVDPGSGGEVYSGAWAFPESSGCCGRSLWYGPMELAAAFAQYGVEANCSWGRELARRMQILATYDGHDTGVSEDNIDGGFVVNADWFKIAHPMALKHLLGSIAWQPEFFSAARENHIVRSSAVVQEVRYGRGRIDYRTFDAPAGTIDILRLAFTPTKIFADGQPLPARNNQAQNGYTIRKLACGDVLLSIRHDGACKVIIEGPDPQSWAGVDQLTWIGPWNTEAGNPACRVAETAGAAMTFSFTGNQVRLIGSVTPQGGLGDIFLDGTRQLVGLDCWNPVPRNQQVLWYRNGLTNGPHTLKVVARGTGNPIARGRKVLVEGIQWSDATGTVDFGEGGGPTDTQRLIFGYPGREDLKDSAGGLWRPGTEFIVRLGAMADSVMSTWWPTPETKPIAGTPDPALYRYGVHAKDFTVNLTVGPGKYHVRLKFAAGRRLDTLQNCVTVFLNGWEVVKRMDVAATAGGPHRAVDLVFNDVAPRNGVIDLRFLGGDPEQGVIGEAFVQAIEVGPGPGGSGTVPVTLVGQNLLRDGGFEKTFPKASAMPPALPGVWEIQGTGLAAPRATRESVSSIAGGGFADSGAGQEALRLVGKGHGRVVQEIAVRPGSLYRGSVWVCARDLDGRGFGHSPGDSAGLLLEELDSTGKVVAAHPKTALAQAGPYRYLSSQITTGPRTARIRFILDTDLGCKPEQGSVTYDQCALEGPPAPANVAGKVADPKGKPLVGALVTVGTQVIRTGPEGGFSIIGLSDRLNVIVQADKQGHYSNKKELVLEAGANRCDLVLSPLPTNNLLRNGHFEEGFAQARSVEHGTTGVRGPWNFQFAPGVLCYIYPESIYTWRKPHIFRGKEAISQVTDGGGELKLYQDVVVDPNIELTASAWILGLDVGGNGKGFGAGAKDFAGLWIQELDSQGQVLVDHRKAGLHKATSDFERVAYTFRTGAKTAKVRFILYSYIGCIWQQGAAIFDECALEKTQPQ